MANLPAILLCERPACELRLAALCLLDRLVIAAHRAGCAPIYLISSESLPRLSRSQALGISFQVRPFPPALGGASLVVKTHVMVMPKDLRRVILAEGRLADRQGVALPVGIATPPIDATFEWPRNMPVVVAEGVAEWVVDPGSAKQAERQLWASLTSAADGFVDQRFNRPVGRWLSKLLVHTPVSPNQVSMASILIGVGSAWFFGLGTYTSGLLGAGLLQLSAIVDCVDGDIARVLYKESSLGKWLDLAGDQVVHGSLFVALAIGQSRAVGETSAFWLGLSAGLGVLIASLVVVRSLRLLAHRPSSRLQRLIDATTNRDFSVLLLALAAANRLHWFLWMAAIGIHLFWISALAVQMGAGATGRNEDKPE